MLMIKDLIEIKGIIQVDKFDATSLKRTSPVFYFNNTVLLSGWTELLKLITGSSANHFNAELTTIGVGTSSLSTTDNTQTDLIATGANTCYKAMVSGYPTAPSSQTIQFKSIFLAAEANFAWEEYVIKNSTSGICLSRGCSHLETKTNADIWYLTWTWGK